MDSSYAGKDNELQEGGKDVAWQALSFQTAHD